MPARRAHTGSPRETIAWIMAGILVLPLVFAGSAAMAQAAKKKVAAGPDASASAVLRKRVRQLEEQLLDMQVMIGTLQSMGPSRGGSAAGSGSRLSGGSGGVRIGQLETQVQALAAQVQSLAAKIGGGFEQRGDAGSAGGPVGSPVGGPVGAYVPGRQYADSPSVTTDALRPTTAPSTFAPARSGSTVATGFGSTTVTPSSAGPGADGISAYLNTDETTAPATRSGRLAALGGDPKQLYETAYGYLLQQNFNSAQKAFIEFLEFYPTDPLAGNAQYWLGETFYVRSKYRSAAKAFLKGYQSYGRGNKAPDSLLKLAMSFDRLGQKDAACSSFGELKVKFPRAPSHVKNRAQSESRRLGC